MSDDVVTSGRKRVLAFRLLRGVRRFRRDARGVAALEFGLIAPILILMLIGAVEITRAVSIDRRLTVVTNTVADLVAREEELTADDVTAIYDIAELMMSPYDAGPLKISLIPVRSSMDNASITRVYPAAQHRPAFNGGALPARCQSYPLAAGFLKEGTSLIVVEGSYQFTPLFGSFIMSGVEWKDTAYASPRKGCVEFYDKAQSPSQREKVCMTSTCFSS
ncbi:TadE/TadG family type IV pilus assembly protein [Hyphomicrobium sp. CS1GBMeth3]|uniref:TadE/TadG family type IV pilus assembly protein n=1 Tax=Hyphomicrobium sp. CS1GBMeth3 TaxID=1892845 RepID=UPI000A5AA479|nr:TadE/TadG family type IV pilus assembly protein [Hyphomicrobium sp. CS1GBMeth3]